MITVPVAKIVDKVELRDRVQMGVSNDEDMRRLTRFTCRTKPGDRMEVRVVGTVEMKCGAKCGGPGAIIHLQ